MWDQQLMRILLAILAFHAFVVGSPAATEEVDYGKQIKPILAEHCYACHGPDEQEAGLRLDTAAALRCACRIISIGC